MKFITGLLVTLVTSLGLLMGSAIAANSDKTMLAANNAAADRIEVISEARYIETKSRKKKKKKKKKRKSRSKKKSIASIRDSAIKSTLGGLGELRPYTTNYKRLKAAVRRYWKRNVMHPTASGLNRTIMRYVKRKHRKLVRSEVYSGAKSGVKKVKRQLKKRKS